MFQKLSQFLRFSALGRFDVWIEVIYEQISVLMCKMINTVSGSKNQCRKCKFESMAS